MTESWIVAAVSVGSIFIQLWISAKRTGRNEEKIDQHGARILQLEESRNDHAERISNIEGRLERHASRG